MRSNSTTVELEEKREGQRNGRGHASFPSTVKVKCRWLLRKHANEMQMCGISGGGTIFMLTLSWKCTVTHTRTKVRWHVAGAMDWSKDERMKKKGADGRLMEMKESLFTSELRRECLEEKSCSGPPYKTLENTGTNLIEVK